MSNPACARRMLDMAVSRPDSISTPAIQIVAISSDLVLMLLAVYVLKPAKPAKSNAIRPKMAVIFCLMFKFEKTLMTRSLWNVFIGCMCPSPIWEDGRTLCAETETREMGGGLKEPGRGLRRFIP